MRRPCTTATVRMVSRVISVIRASTISQNVTNIVVFGENPRALAVNTNGTKVYPAFALSGNRTTIVSASNAPPQPPPTNTNLPAPPQVGLIVDATDPNYYSVSGIDYTLSHKKRPDELPVLL